MLTAGANGYMLKTAGKDEIFHAASSVLAGATFFSSTVSNIVIKGFVERAKSESSTATVSEKPEMQESALTRRENEVLRLIAEGLTNREIGDRLFLSVRTINTHRTNLMRKLELHDTAGLVRYAMSHGMMSAETADMGNSPN